MKDFGNIKVGMTLKSLAYHSSLRDIGTIHKVIYAHGYDSITYLTIHGVEQNSNSPEEWEMIAPKSKRNLPDWF